MGWQPNFTSYIPGHDCPWGPHRLTRPCSAPTPILDRIPHLEDLQVSWLMLLYCANPRCTCLLRMCSPNLTTEFANNHNLAVAVSAASSKSKTSKPRRTYHSLSQGGVVLTCASILATPAFWSSFITSYLQPTPSVCRTDFRAAPPPRRNCPQYPSSSRCSSRNGVVERDMEHNRRLHHSSKKIRRRATRAWRRRKNKKKNLCRLARRQWTLPPPKFPLRPSPWINYCHLVATAAWSHHRKHQWFECWRADAGCQVLRFEKCSGKPAEGHGGPQGRHASSNCKNG